MRTGTLVILASAALLGGAGGGLRLHASNNPYEGIVVRNAFALHPIPPAIVEPVVPTAPALEVFLTGISTLDGNKKVLLQLEDKSPGKKTEYLPPLIEKDVQGRIEVVAIDPKKGEVVVKIDGTAKTLSFEKNSPKPGPAGPPSPVPALATRPAGLVPRTPAQVMADASAVQPSRPGVVVGGWTPPGSGTGSLPGPPGLPRSTPPVPGFNPAR